MRRVGEQYLYHIVCLDAVVGFDGYAIDEDVTFLGCLLYLVTGGILYEVHQEFIYPQGFLSLAGGKGVMLIEGG